MRSTPRLPDPEVNLPKEHALQEAALLVLGAGALLALLFACVSYFVDAVVWLMPPEAEASLLAFPAWQGGADASEQAGERLRVATLLSALAKGWPDNPYEFQVNITEEDAPNAFALPGGRVLVTRGLLQRVESENELAMVLAHEIGHFKNRDHLRGLGRGALLSLLVAGAGFGGDNALLSTTSGLMSLSYGRKQESRADAFGLQLVAAHYGHVAGSGDFFARMQADESALDESLPGFLRSHPGSGDRVAALRKLAEEAGYVPEGVTNPWAPKP